MKEHSQQKTMALGNKIRGLVDKESKFTKPPTPNTLKRERMAKLGLKQGFEKVQQKADGTQLTHTEDGEVTIKHISMPHIFPNPKDK